MTKEEYVEHSRALFANPLLNYVVDIAVNSGYLYLENDSADSLLVGSQGLPDCSFNRSAFEIGGKHYKEVTL